MRRRLRRTATFGIWIVMLALSPRVGHAQPVTPADGRQLEPLSAREIAALEPLPALGSVLKAAAADFRRLPTTENLIVISAGIGLSAFSTSGDHRLTRALSGSEAAEEMFEPGRLVGGALFQLGGATLTYAVGRLTRSPAVAGTGADLLRAGLVAQALTQGLKLAARRTRPDGSSYSFPSGHAAGTFASATVLQRRFGWKIGVPAYAVAAYVAANRMTDNRHFLSDLVFGAAIGVAAGRTVTLGVGERRFTLVPTVTPGGAGISFVSVGR